MFLTLSHQSLEVYKASRELVFKCYKITRQFPPDEKFALVQQIRRAAVSVFLNIAEGFSRKSTLERKRFFEIARGSVVEIDAAFDISIGLELIQSDELQQVNTQILDCFKMLSSLIHLCQEKNRNE